MCWDDARPLTFENLLRDPLVRMVMDSDGVTVQQLVEVLETARLAIVAREMTVVRAVAAGEAV